MATEALQTHMEEEGIRAAFMSNHRGEVCIAFSDPVYARADAILINPDNRALHVLIHENAFFISQVSEAMAHAFVSNKEALLTAVRADGSLLELTAPIQVGHA